MTATPSAASGDLAAQASTPATRAETGPSGLTRAEVAERTAAGLVNDGGARTSRTLAEIVRANVFTRFNAILGTMLALILVFGSPADGLFGIVLVINALIGIVQELRAKRTLDQLAVLSAPVAHVVRDGKAADVAVETVVLDDLLELRTGDQLPADGVVRDAAGLELDESLLTGESDPILKRPGDPGLSGSIVVAGNGRMQATAVGADAYARQLATEARRFTLVHSELVAGINLILKYVTWVLVVVGPLLFWRQLGDQSVPDAITAAVAGVVGMVPEGLVLLTSIAFGVAAMSLARQKVLVQELPAVEGLARVDVVCLDKTGTLTEGAIEFARAEPLDGSEPELVDAALRALAHDDNPNGTLVALAAAYPEATDWVRTGAVPFSSARKWSAVTFENNGSWVFGAPEMVWPDPASPVRVHADAFAAAGHRTLLLAHRDGALDAEVLPDDLTPVALVLFDEKVRPDAGETLAYFRRQGVALKVISGDNPRTVGAVARRVGMDDAGEPFDARELPEDVDALAEILEHRSVFGRVTPHQKRAMVKALQSRGHVVAMTGDGVNDALALKDADIGVAMGSGAAATRAVAQIVLLDGRFATLPGVVAEGRRVAANIERVANLFLTKTTYAALLAIAVVLTGWRYPFLPRHLTVVSSLTIGIPAFFLAFAPSKQRYEAGFVRRVLHFAVPAGSVVAVCVFLSYGLARNADISTREARTTATLVLLILALYVLVLLARPFTRYRAILVAAMIGAFVGVLVIGPLRSFYKFTLPPNDVLSESVLIAIVGCVVMELGYRFVLHRGGTIGAAATPSRA